jgi:hypothetical protein
MSPEQEILRVPWKVTLVTFIGFEFPLCPFIKRDRDDRRNAVHNGFHLFIGCVAFRPACGQHFPALEYPEHADISSVSQHHVDGRELPCRASDICPARFCGRQDTVFGELMGNAAYAHVQLDEHLENREPHGSFFRVDHIVGFVLVAPLPPVGGASGRNRQVMLQPGLPVPVRVFDNLLALGLRAPCEDGTYELAGKAVVDVFADADDLAAVALDFLEDHRGMDEVTGEAAQVPHDNHIRHVVTDELAGKRKLLAVRIMDKPALGFLQDKHDIHVMQLGILAAFFCLKIEAFAVLLLLIGADAAIHNGAFPGGGSLCHSSHRSFF